MEAWCMDHDGDVASDDWLGRVGTMAAELK
ncbi:uncharacterized protein G2W53_006839 [Senna tora]|uniref:Uncharacterized protein n=1 Tax=Senna tora TaxID=362788 RepID=A0A834X4S2_9FABA|nr:uncharacterized protein G2W53_006839 [Senna tora]